MLGLLGKQFNLECSARIRRRSNQGITCTAIAGLLPIDSSVHHGKVFVSLKRVPVRSAAPTFELNSIQLSKSYERF